jgi:hypothetical protein
MKKKILPRAGVQECSEVSAFRTVPGSGLGILGSSFSSTSV